MGTEPAMSGPPSDAAVAAGLGSPLCARCGYPLTGLPAAGVCPECGRAYGGAEVILYGYAAGSKATHYNRRPPTRWQLAGRWAWSVPVLGFWAWAFAGHGLFGPVWVAVSVSLGLIVATYRGVRGEAVRPDTVLVRLTPAGAVQLDRSTGPVPYDRVDDARLVPWSKLGRATVQPAVGGLVRITLGRPVAWWKLQVDHVDAVVRCRALGPLRRQIARWQADASR